MVGGKKLIFAIIVGFLISIVASPLNISVAQTERSCGTKDYQAGIDSPKSKFTRTNNRGGEIDFHITTKEGLECLLSRTLSAANLTLGNFESDPGYGSSKTFSAYKIGAVRIRNSDGIANFYVVIGEDAESGGKANFKGIFLQHAFSSGEIIGQDINKKFRTLEEYDPLNEDDISYPNFIARYNALNAVRGKDVEGGVIKKIQYTLKVDLDIDYTGSDVGELNDPPYQPNGEEPWDGVRKTLPGLSDDEDRVTFQLWYSPTEQEDKQAYVFVRSISSPLGTNPSAGGYEFKADLAEGSYVATSLLQIRNRGSVLNIIDNGYDASIVEDIYENVGSPGDVPPFAPGLQFGDIFNNQNGQLLNIYSGLSGNDRIDIFVAQQNFEVGTANTIGSFNPIYKSFAKTRDVIKELLGDCGIDGIMGKGNIGGIFNEMIRCIYEGIFKPALIWAAEIVDSAAGVSYRGRPATIGLIPRPTYG